MIAGVVLAKLKGYTCWIIQLDCFRAPSLFFFLAQEFREARNAWQLFIFVSSATLQVTDKTQFTSPIVYRTEKRILPCFRHCA